MKPFDYISVLLSIVLSLTMAHILVGVADLIKNGFQRFSISLAIWIGFVFFLCVDFWFSIWGARNETGWSLAYVGTLLLQVSLNFIAARLIVPVPEKDEQIDMTAFFARYRRKFAAVAFLQFVVGGATNVTLPGFGSLMLSGIVLVFLLIFAAMWLWESYAVQLAISVLAVVMTTYYAVKFIPTL